MRHFQSSSYVRRSLLVGADFCHQTSAIVNDETSITSTLFDYICNRSVLLYHPLACNGQSCVDISTCTSQMNGRLNNGLCLRLRSFAQSLLNLGGCPILYPLIDLFKETDYNDQMTTDPSISSGDSETNQDLIIVRKHSQKHLTEIDNRIVSNPIASVLNLLRCAIASSSSLILAEQMTKQYNVELLAQHLLRLSSFFIDQQFLIAIQQLIECSRFVESSHSLTNQLIQYILLDFALWNKAKFSVRTAHLQYVTAIIKDEKKYYRAKFGVQFFLDALRHYFKYEHSFH
jgi:neurobeachin-like protein 1/2